VAKDKNDVQQEEAQTETESTETGTQETEEKAQPQFLTREEVQQMLAEERERIKQSSRDIARREIGTARRGQKFAEDTLAGYDTGLGQLDPEQAQSIKAQAELAAYRRKEAEDAQRQQMATFDKSFHDNITQFITSAGLDPTDKRIDWAEDVQGDYLTKQQRILASVSKAQKEDASSKEEKKKQEAEDVKAKEREEIDSVDTSASGGAGTKDWRKLSAADQIKAGLKEGQQKKK